MSGFMSTVLSRWRRRLGFYGVLAAGGLAIYGISNVITKIDEAKYVEGPYGKKSRVELDELEFNNRKSFSLGTFQYAVHRTYEYVNASEEIKTYVNRAIENYKHGYTFTDGDAIMLAIAEAVLYSRQIVELTWPIPMK